MIISGLGRPPVHGLTPFSPLSRLLNTKEEITARSGALGAGGMEERERSLNYNRECFTADAERT